ncbi:hypothetical protein P2318_32725 [Myxococcaceae bacterium GXIMD 01537]
MLPHIASTLDTLHESFLQSLPSSLQGHARALWRTLPRAPAPDTPWGHSPRTLAPSALPLLLAEGLSGALAPTVREAARAHLLAHLARLATQGLADGSVKPSPETEALLAALREGRDAALERLGARLPATPRTDYALAEEDAAAALAEARALLRQRAPVSLETYERLMLRAHATAFPAPLALVSVAGCNEARKRVLHQAVAGLAMSAQARSDALDWEEDESRGASWAVCLMRQRMGGAPPAHPAELRRVVQGSGVLVRLLEHTREHFAEVKRAAGWVGARGLERLAETEERNANMLARTEARSPGHAVQWKAQHPATV